MSELAMASRDFAPPRSYPREYSDVGSNDRSRPERPAVDSARTAKVAIATALAFVAVSALALAVALPATEIRRMTVTGASTIDPSELAAWSGLPAEAHWFSVDCAAIEAGIAAHPRVASVSVERRFPNTLVAAVAERVPVAVVYAAGASGRTEAHCVDGSGVVFAPASDYPLASSLPVLSGLEIRGLRYGLRLEGACSTLLASLEALGKTDPALVSAISELRLVSKAGMPAELLVYPARYLVPVRMRPVLNAGLLKSMMLVLDVVDGEGLSPTIRELDLRTDTFVYRTKEAVSG